MKTTRRQELRTNELSQQIDQAGDYVKQNATILTLVIVVAAVVVIGGFWFSNRQNTIEADAWADLRAPEADEDAMEVIGHYQDVADDRISEAITTTALLRIGDLALAEVGNPAPASDDGSQPTTDPAEFTAKARAAFQQIITNASDDLTAYGHALMAMGIIEENAGDFEKARQWYDRVAKAEKLANTPFKAEAAYRLASLDTWSQEIVFPAPPPIEAGPPSPMGLGASFDPLAPSINTKPKPIAPAAKPSENIKLPPVSVEPKTPAAKPTPSPAAVPPAAETPKPTPTTQPAGN